MERSYDLIIIGAGPGGMTAAIYGSRAGLSTLILEMGAPGGKLIKTNEISNWPGIQKVNGAELASQMFAHATSFGADYAYGEVTSIQVDGDEKRVVCSDGTTYTGKAVIIASGTVERMLGIPGEAENVGRGVSYCAVCDGAFFRDQEVAVIGGGNSALEEALYLTQFAKKVTIVIRRDVFRAEAHVQQQVEQNERITIIRRHVPKQILDDGNRVIGLVIEDVESKETTTLTVAGVFPYVGADPAVSFLNGLDICDERGYLLVDEHNETKIKGIYGVGDVVAKPLRQVVTAAGDGANAAQHAFHAIKGI